MTEWCPPPPPPPLPPPPQADLIACGQKKRGCGAALHIILRSSNISNFLVVVVLVCARLVRAFLKGARVFTLDQHSARVSRNVAQCTRALLENSTEDAMA